jgi:hypothetical protein
LNINPLIVYVQLGSNPSPTLFHFATISQRELPEAKTVLITNAPRSWQEFPGDVIDSTPYPRNASITRLIKRFPEREQTAGSYWIYTLERLFILEILSRFYPLETPILHVESDCYSLIDGQVYGELLARCSKVAVPRYSNTLGISSVLFAPTLNLLMSTLGEFNKIIDNSKIWLGDMNLLGIGLNSDLLHELPTQLSDGWDLAFAGSADNQQKIIFDGLAIGQYLLGQDPYHTGGYAVAGHVNECFMDPIDKWFWSIAPTQADKQACLFAEYKETKYRVANIHVHSKIPIPPLEIDNHVWESIIATANGVVQPVPKLMPDYKIHTGQISIINRFRFARRNGIMRLLRQMVKRIFIHTKKSDF